MSCATIPYTDTVLKIDNQIQELSAQPQTEQTKKTIAILKETKQQIIKSSAEKVSADKYKFVVIGFCLFLVISIIILLLKKYIP